MKQMLGLTLIEMLMVLLIFGVLFVAVTSILFTSDTSWRVGYNKSVEQQEIRRIMDNLHRLARSTKPAWVTISADVDADHDKILFYKLDFNNATFNNTTYVTTVPSGPWVILKSNANNSNEFMKKEEGGNWITIAQHIRKIKFNGGNCAGCNCNFSNSSCLSCMSVANSTSECPLVRVEINATREKGCSLVSYLQLRNDDYNATSALPTPPPEGEF